MRTAAPVPGEGICPEIVSAAVRAIYALDTGIAWQRPVVGELGFAHNLRAGSDEAKPQLAAADATLFRATFGPSVPTASG